MMSFEIRSRDAGARLCKVIIGEKRIETPLFLPVYNPHVPIITPGEMEREFGVKALMTNAYLIYKDEEQRKEAISQGVHRMIGFSGVVFSDSGAYQTFRGDIGLTQREIVGFQEKIGSDVGVMLDVPSRHESYQETRESVLKTVERAKEWDRIRSKGEICWEGAIQGGGFPDLVRLSCKRMRRFDFDMFAVGVPPRLWSGYEFDKILLQGITAKKNLPLNKLIHAFGMGHPMVTSLLVATGFDVFDSASYSIYARNSRYLTEFGTKRIEELEFLPCNCPVCKKYGAADLREMEGRSRVRALAKHNLHSILREMRVVKEAIHGHRLWELVQQRARAHPKLLEALTHILRKYNKFFQKTDPIRKRSALFYLGGESRYRPEIKRALQRVRTRLGSRRVPRALEETYPFGQSVSLGKILKFGDKKYGDLEKIRRVADFQFGMGVGRILFPDGVNIEKSSATTRIRRIWLDGRLLATMRARDGFFALRINGAKLVHKALKYPKYRVAVIDDEEIHGIVSRGGNVFAKFVLNCDKKIVPREETLVVDSKDNLLAVGEAVLSGEEMLQFDHGLAVKSRDGVNAHKDKQ